eukprot:Gb_32231 [translate_table: standard]
MNKMREEENGRQWKSISLEEDSLREREFAMKKCQLELKEKELAIREREIALKERQFNLSLWSKIFAPISHPIGSPLSPNHTPSTSSEKEIENPSRRPSSRPCSTNTHIPRCSQSILSRYQNLHKSVAARIGKVGYHKLGQGGFLSFSASMVAQYGTLPTRVENQIALTKGRKAVTEYKNDKGDKMLD